MVADNLYNAVAEFSYTPFSSTIQSSPWLFPMDGVSVIDKNGNAIYSVIMDVTFTMNGVTSIRGVGETTTNKGYASQNPLTAREKVIINSIRQNQNEQLHEQIQNVIHFNELISNALGLYVTPIQQPDGSSIYYIHDKPELSESMVIFTMTAGGIAWTDRKSVV